MLGIILGLGCSAVFGGNSIITRRGLFRVSSNYVAAISIFTGLLFFTLVAWITGDLFGITRLSPKAYLFWSLSGIIHFSLGRTWSYRSLQLLGSNRSNVVTSLSPIATVALAMVLLNEKVTPIQVIGIIFTLSGPLLMVLKEETMGGSSSPTQSGSHGRDISARTMLVGVLYGAGTAVFWGSSPIFIKFGLEAGGGPMAGSLIAYAGATVFTSPSFLLSADSRREIWMEGAKPLPISLFSGLTTSVAQLLRYLAFAHGSVIVVSLMLRTLPIWVLVFAFIFNRQYESFSRWVFLGNGLLMIGTILVIMS